MRRSLRSNLLGHGCHPADLVGMTLTGCVQAVVESADNAGFDRFVLVGHSLFGVTITETAWREPARITHVAYVGATVPVPGMSQQW